jgi:6-pyruvoyltetrahydropterin/6-carboxytetrahydropterin synthase
MVAPVRLSSGVRRVEVAYRSLSDADPAVARREAASSSTTVLVSRRESFNAAHQLRDPALSDEDNQRLFGKCANLHGHNYVLEVVVAGEIDPRTGYVLDLKRLSDLICRLVVQEVDHRNLNTDVSWLRERIPTAENLAAAFWDRLRPELPEGSLHSLRLWETDKNWAEVRDRV